MAIHADFVPRPLFEPHHCSFTLRSEDPDGFFQGRNLTGPADVALISVSRVRTYAESLGFVHPDDHEMVVVQLAASVLDVMELKADVERLQGQLDAIDVLTSAGFTARKKVGRPKSPEKQEAVA
jgi:hypothetical protein